MNELFDFPTPDVSTFDKSRFVMREVNYQTAHKIITDNHYSHCMPCCELAIGFFVDNILNCVVVFGQSATCKMADSLPSSNYWELSRLFSFDWAGRNTESYCISQSLKYIEENYQKDLIISFADPNENHIGYIYQATNWLYCGQSQPDEWYIIEGKKLHPRTVVANYGTRGEDKLRQMGYDFKREYLAGKHRYIYLLGSKGRRKELRKKLKYPILPYPKLAGEVSRAIRTASSCEGSVQSRQPAL